MDGWLLNNKKEKINNKMTNKEAIYWIKEVKRCVVSEKAEKALEMSIEALMRTSEVDKENNAKNVYDKS